jgi:hypothetical protein
MEPRPLRQATPRQIRSALMAVFDKHPDDPPNVDTMCQLTKKELELLGLRASDRQIQDVGDEPGLKVRRRPRGRQKKPERPVGPLI